MMTTGTEHHEEPVATLEEVVVRDTEPIPIVVQPFISPLNNINDSLTSWLGNARHFKLASAGHLCSGGRRTVILSLDCASCPRMEVVSDSSDCCPCFANGEAGNEKRVRVGTISGVDGCQFEEKLSFHQISTGDGGCCGIDNDNESKRVDFFSPDSDSTIGWLEYTTNSMNRAKIGLNVNEIDQPRFFTRPQIGGEHGVVISNSVGQIVATASVTKWRIYRGSKSYEEFQLLLAARSGLLPDAEKVLLIGVFVLWVRNAGGVARNKNMRNGIISTILGIILFLVFFAIRWAIMSS